MDFLRRSAVLIGVLLLALIFLGGTGLAKQWIVTTGQSNSAFEYAKGYVNNQVAYQYGGRLTVEEYKNALAEGKEPGQDIGVDSSAVVLNAYRSILPDIRFWTNAHQNRTYSDVSSSTLYHWNRKPLAKHQLVPGDLVFFKTTGGNIMGVGLFSHFQGNVIHFIVASANAGQVVLTNVDTNGSYWHNHFAGFGRLQYTLLP